MIIILSLSLLMVITVGYAAFGTSLQLKAKGNIKERNNLYVSSKGSNITGNGTKEKPYLTIQKAYDSAWENATIWIMDNITVNNTVNFDENKNVILTSYGSEIYSVLRGEENQFILHITNGEITTKNININGQNKNAQRPLVRCYKATCNFNSETTIQNNINVGTDGGSGASFNTATVNINGAKFLNNKQLYTGGGGGAFLYRYSNVTINEGEFIGNTCESVGGAIFFGDKGYTLTINNATFKNNKALNSGGAIAIASSTLNFNGGEISNNEATNWNGGGIFIYSLLSDPKNGYSDFTMRNGNITNNKANKNGGGIYITPGNTYNYISGTISNNTPDNVYK